MPEKLKPPSEPQLVSRYQTGAAAKNGLGASGVVTETGEALHILGFYAECSKVSRQKSCLME